VSACGSTPKTTLINQLHRSDRPEPARIIYVSETPAHDTLSVTLEAGVERVETTISPDPLPTPRVEKEVRTELPVGFKIGEYRHASAADIRKLGHALMDDQLTITRIDIVGHSRSRTDLATERLAMKRAKIVRQALVNNGISPSVIHLNTDVRNYQTRVGAHPGAVVTLTQLSSASVQADTHKSVQAVVPVVDDKPIIEEVIEEVIEEIIIQTDPVYVLHVEQGSLKANIIRILDEHHYSLGQWSFDEPGMTWDKSVANDFYYPLMGGLPEILSVIHRLYRVQAMINTVDRTVDFKSAGEVG